MKKIAVTSLSLLFLFSAAACSNQSSKSEQSSQPVELVKVKADIIKDKHISGSTIETEGKDKGKEYVPTTLVYDIKLKNVTNKKLGGAPKNAIEVEIVPKDNLRKTMKDAIGLNIFDEQEYIDSDIGGIGYGTSFDGGLDPKGKGDYQLNYELGFDEKEKTDKQVYAQTPSKETLAKIKKEAYDATVVVKEGKKKIAEFDLDKADAK